MAPFRKLTRKEIEIQQKPWITQGILKFMNKRDSIYKEFAIETDDANKLQLGKLYKEYRNKVVFILRKAKQKILLLIFSRSTISITKKPGKASEI
jgi:hypothetical protein